MHMIGTVYTKTHCEIMKQGNGAIHVCISGKHTINISTNAMLIFIR